ncbi:hypothetical protein GCM10009678_01120 [Actinomadura kijaniata]|uniref:Uncharacterized protein n=1 Tax=Actinomadura namibiensis TaxID=182080 RepID=A0A7W3LS94_ACTNM|nr:hypothetical protein [Actinomadura namibiensis]MBA8953360.1 hypothetical protein [Actinomadura namibiensis]
MADWELFDQVGEVVRGSAPRDLGDLHLRIHRAGVKAWFGDPEPPREHYEAQLISADIVTEARSSALEIGFHAEHRAEADNEAAVERLRAREAAWRGELGEDAVVGAFLGRGSWRRISELWLDPELDDTDAALEVGVRLVEYMRALEPLRR